MTIKYKMNTKMQTEHKDTKGPKKMQTYHKETQNDTKNRPKLPQQIVKQAHSDTKHVIRDTQ